MQIRQQQLAQYLKRQLAAIYVLVGQDNYLLDEAQRHIKSAAQTSRTCDEHSLQVHNAEDWNQVIEEANSYSLFSDGLVLSIYFDKKTIDAASKKTLTNYLLSPNTRTTLIIKAPNVSAKQIPWLVSNEHVVVVQAYPLSTVEMKQWIVQQLKNCALNYAANIPELIQQYTQGNMLAAAQVIEKLSLSTTTGELVEVQHLQAHLSDQCEFSLFELGEYCLQGHADKAIHLLRQATENKTEATLVLWVLTQEIRNLLQLHQALQQKIDFKTACTELKIWPQRMPMYQAALKRIQPRELQSLLHHCRLIDEQIKSSMNSQSWSSLEVIALSLSTGHLIGESCIA